MTFAVTITNWMGVAWMAVAVGGAFVGLAVLAVLERIERKAQR